MNPQTSETQSSQPDTHEILVYDPSRHWDYWYRFRDERLADLRSRSQVPPLDEYTLQSQAARYAQQKMKELQAAASRNASSQAATLAPTQVPASVPRAQSARASRIQYFADALFSPVAEGRHSRKCAVCRHPNRSAIEEDFLRWRSPERLARAFGIPHHSAIYRHAHALRLFARRSGLVRHALEYIIERADDCFVTGETVIHAIRAYASLNPRGEWVEPPKHVIFSSTPAPAPPAASVPGKVPKPTRHVKNLIANRRRVQGRRPERPTGVEGSRVRKTLIANSAIRNRRKSLKTKERRHS